MPQMVILQWMEHAPIYGIDHEIYQCFGNFLQVAPSNAMFGILCGTPLGTCATW